MSMSEGAEQQVQAEVVVDDLGTVPSYSNFCRVTATSEEVIMDFGLNPPAIRGGPSRCEGKPANCHELLHGPRHDSPAP